MHALLLAFVAAGVEKAEVAHHDGYRGNSAREKHLVEESHELKGKWEAKLEEMHQRGLDNFIPAKEDSQSLLQVGDEPEGKPTFDQVEAKLTAAHSKLQAAFAKYDKMDGNDMADAAPASFVEAHMRAQAGAKVSAKVRAMHARAQLQAVLAEMQRKTGAFAHAVQSVQHPSSLLEAGARVNPPSDAVLAKLQQKLGALHQQIKDDWGPTSLLQTSGMSGQDDGSKARTKQIDDKFQSMAASVHALNAQVAAKNAEFAAKMQSWSAAPSSLLETLADDPADAAFQAKLNNIVLQDETHEAPNTEEFQLPDGLPQRTRDAFKRAATLLQETAAGPTSLLETEDGELQFGASAAQDQALRKQFKVVDSQFQKSFRGLSALATRFKEDNREFTTKMGELALAPSSLLETLDGPDPMKRFEKKLAEYNRKLDTAVAKFKRDNPPGSEAVAGSLLEEAPDGADDPELDAVWKQADADLDKWHTKEEAGYKHLEAEANGAAPSSTPNAALEADLLAGGTGDGDAEPTSLLEAPDRFSTVEAKLDAMMAKIKADAASFHAAKVPASLLQDEGLVQTPQFDSILAKLQRLQDKAVMDPAPTNPSASSLLEKTDPHSSFAKVAAKLAQLKAKYSSRNYAKWLQDDTAKRAADLSQSSLLQTDGLSDAQLTHAQLAHRVAQRALDLHARTALDADIRGGMELVHMEKDGIAKRKSVSALSAKELDSLHAEVARLKEHMDLDQEARQAILALMHPAGGAPASSFVQRGDTLAEAQDETDFRNLKASIHSLDDQVRQQIADHARAMGEPTPTSFLQEGEHSPTFMQMHEKHLAMQRKTDADFAKLSKAVEPRSSFLQAPAAKSDAELDLEMKDEQQGFASLGDEAAQFEARTEQEERDADKAAASPVLQDERVAAEVHRLEGSLLEEPPRKWYPLDVASEKTKLDKIFQVATDSAAKFEAFTEKADHRLAPASLAQRADPDATEAAVSAAHAAAADADVDADADADAEDPDAEAEADPAPMTDDGSRALTFQDLTDSLSSLKADIAEKSNDQLALHRDIMQNDARAKASLEALKQHRTPIPYGPDKGRTTGREFGDPVDPVESLLQQPNAFELAGSMLEQPAKDDPAAAFGAVSDSMARLTAKAAADRREFEQKHAAARAKYTPPMPKSSSFIEDHTVTGKAAAKHHHHHHRHESGETKSEQAHDIRQKDMAKDEAFELNIDTRSREMGEKLKELTAEAREEMASLREKTKGFMPVKQPFKPKDAERFVPGAPTSLEQYAAQADDAEPEVDPRVLAPYLDESRWSDHDDTQYVLDHQHDSGEDQGVEERRRLYDEMTEEEDSMNKAKAAGKEKDAAEEKMNKEMNAMLAAAGADTAGLAEDAKAQAAKDEPAPDASFLQEDPDEASQDMKPFGFYDSKDKADQAEFDRKTAAEIEDVRGLEAQNVEEDANPKTDPYQGVKDMLKDDATSLLQTRASAKRTHATVDDGERVDYSNGATAKFQAELRSTMDSWKDQWENAAKVPTEPSSLLQEQGIEQFMTSRKAPTMAEARKEFDHVKVLEARLEAQTELMKADTERYSAQGKLGSLVETAPGPEDPLAKISNQLDSFKARSKEEHKRFEQDTRTRPVLDGADGFTKVKAEIAQEREKLRAEATKYRDQADAVSRPSSFLESPGADLEADVHRHNEDLRTESYFNHPEVALAKVQYGAAAHPTDDYEKAIQQLNDDGRNLEGDVADEDAVETASDAHFVADEQDNLEANFRDAARDQKEEVGNNDPRFDASYEPPAPKPAAATPNLEKQDAQLASSFLEKPESPEAGAARLIKALEAPAPAEALAPDLLADAGVSADEIAATAAAQPADPGLQHAEKLEQGLTSLLKEQLTNAKEESSLEGDYIAKDRAAHPYVAGYTMAVPKKGDDDYTDLEDAPDADDKPAPGEQPPPEFDMTAPPADDATSLLQRGEHVKHHHGKHDRRYKKELSSLEQRMAMAQQAERRSDRLDSTVGGLAPDVSVDDTWLQAGEAPPAAMIDTADAAEATRGTGFAASDLLPHESASTRSFEAGAGLYAPDSVEFPEPVDQPESLVELGAAQLRTH